MFVFWGSGGGGSALSVRVRWSFKIWRSLFEDSVGDEMLRYHLEASISGLVSPIEKEECLTPNPRLKRCKKDANLGPPVLLAVIVNCSFYRIESRLDLC